MTSVVKDFFATRPSAKSLTVSLVLHIIVGGSFLFSVKVPCELARNGCEIVLAEK